MYSWSALVTSQILVEVPWNLIGSSLFFICWYWTVGYETSRAGYTYLLIGVIFPLYYTTLSGAAAALAPTAEIAGLVYSLMFSFIITL
jgi:ATP-binding cassette subfamily G (WHITE) protein 2 (SNQ2)